MPLSFLVKDLVKTLHFTIFWRKHKLQMLQHHVSLFKKKKQQNTKSCAPAKPKSVIAVRQGPPHTPSFFFFLQKIKVECLSLSCYNKIPQTWWLTNNNLFPTVLEARKSKVKALVGLVPHESPLPGSKSHLFTVSSHNGRGRTFWGLFFKTLIPVMKALPSWPNHLPEVPPHVISTYELGRGDHKISVYGTV